MFFGRAATSRLSRQVVARRFILRHLTQIDACKLSRTSSGSALSEKCIEDVRIVEWFYAKISCHAKHLSTGRLRSSTLPAFSSEGRNARTALPLDLLCACVAKLRLRAAGLRCLAFMRKEMRPCLLHASRFAAESYHLSSTKSRNLARSPSWCLAAASVGICRIRVCNVTGGKGGTQRNAIFIRNDCHLGA